MDKATFDRYFEKETGKADNKSEPLNLTPEERQLYALLKENNWRLEQEKIPIKTVLETLIAGKIEML